MNTKLSFHFQHSLPLITMAIILSASLLLINTAYGQNDSNQDSSSTIKIAITEWLITSPQPGIYPLFGEEKNMKGKIYSDEDLLSYKSFLLSELDPVEKELFLPTYNIRWEAVSTESDKEILPQKGKSDAPYVVWMATRLHVSRWLSGDLKISGSPLFTVWLDGQKLGDKRKAGTEDKPGDFKKSVKLEQGTHLLLIKIVVPAKHDVNRALTAEVELKPPFSESDFTPSTDPSTPKQIHQILDGLRITGVSLSPSGIYCLKHYKETLPPDGTSESWSEVREMQSNKLVHTFRHSGAWRISWLPGSDKLSYIARKNQKYTIYLLDFEKGEITPLLKDEENLSGYTWAPDESFLIYTVWEKFEEKDKSFHKVEGMPDRQPGWRNRSFLYKYDIATGLSNRLTWGKLSTYIQDISPDSKKMLFSQSFPDFSERPYSRQNLYLLDLSSYQLDTIRFEESWGVSAKFSPDGKYLLIKGGPSCFGVVGLNVSEGKIAHNSDNQLYLYDIATKDVKSLTLNFNPSVEQAFWHPVDKNIYFTVVEKDYRKLYKLDMTKERFHPIDTETDYLTSISFAKKALTAVYKGNKTNDYPKWYILNLKNLKYNLYDDTEKEIYKHTPFGEIKNWDFTASSGINITGRVYYPPNFDSTAKYPVIVYYYGGISPVARSFGGRYPFNLWAGNGYIVYVLQPSGAVGFGQEFSAAHVNNWGITVADEIIEGTKLFLASHPYADASKVGCIGASYGGFMTMLLLTRTDIFAAAVAHAGISSISSYWGEGFWGYSYSAGASANSFPWNNKELYVGQSPLFNADKVNTPLLLTHGDKDTNVPPGESIQMYTALKLLEKPVELVLVKGEDHHIVDYKKRIMWHNTIMAWWDKQLKNQQEWWDELYPKNNF